MAEYIDRTLLLSDIDAAVNNNGMGYVIGQTLKRYVKRQSSADVAPVVHGHMEERTVDNECPWYKVYDCSECGCTVEIWHNYCPFCGAKMDGERRTNDDTESH